MCQFVLFKAVFITTTKYIKTHYHFCCIVMLLFLILYHANIILHSIIFKAIDHCYMYVLHTTIGCNYRSLSNFYVIKQSLVLRYFNII